MEKKLFYLVQNIGEGIFNKIHIIDNTEFETHSFRIYHSDGYCWNILQEEQFDDIDNPIDPYYEFSESWEGFKESGIEFAISEIEQIQ